MKKAMSLMLMVSLLLTLTVACAESAPLQFNEDGSFRILILADSHVGHENRHINTTMPEFLNRVMADNPPDLIVLLGDNTHGNDADLETVTANIHELMNMLDPLGIPVAMVFGNHEDERQSNCPLKSDQIKVFEQHESFVGCAGMATEHCVGNYNLPILSSDGSRAAFNLWFFDNTSGVVEQPILDWYVQESDVLKAANGGVPVPAMAFQHIPVRSGDSAQVAAHLQQGDVRSLVFGHVHENPRVETYEGIDFVIMPTWSKLGVSFGYFDRGIGVINLNENDLTTFEYFTVRPQDLGEMWFYGLTLPENTIITVQ